MDLIKRPQPILDQWSPLFMLKVFFFSILYESWKRMKWGKTGFELAVRNSQFVMRFGSFRLSFCIFSKNYESLKSDTLWIFRFIHWNSYILRYFKPIKYPLLNNNVISQRFIVHINFKIHTSFFFSYHFVTI